MGRVESPPSNLTRPAVLADRQVAGRGSSTGYRGCHAIVAQGRSVPDWGIGVTPPNLPLIGGGTDRALGEIKSNAPGRFLPLFRGRLGGGTLSLSSRACRSPGYRAPRR